MVLLESGLDEHPTGHHCSNAPPQRVDLELVHCPVECVELLGIQFAYECGEFLTDVVFDQVVFDFGWFTDAVVGGFEYVEYELKHFLSYVGDSNLNIRVSVRYVPFT